MRSQGQAELRDVMVLEPLRSVLGSAGRGCVERSLEALKAAAVVARNLLINGSGVCLCLRLEPPAGIQSALGNSTALLAANEPRINASASGPCKSSILTASNSRMTSRSTN